MKKITSFILAAVALLLLALPASAQVVARYSPQTLGTFICQPQAATNVGYVIDCTLQKDALVGFINQMSTSATDNQTIAYSRSVDGINYGTTLFSVALAPTASAKSIQFTNLASNGGGFIKINWVTNAAATGIATNTLQYAVKIGAP